MGETKSIKKPSDLYPLNTDDKEKHFTDGQIEFFNRRLTDQEIRLIKEM